MKIMGILNVTPDSFSDGGRWVDPQNAVLHAEEMWAEGADIIDVGAESTRPGSTRIGADEEWRRLAPILPELLARGMTVSVDTIHAATAKKALELGVDIVNDISGGCYDPRMNRVVADSDARYIIQHWRGFPGDPDLDCNYGDAVAETLAETLEQVRRALDAGVRSEQVIIDPGLGFALRGADCWKIVENLQMWVQDEYPVLVGASRKRFVRERYGDRLLEGTLRVTEACRDAGVWGVRVHDVAASREISSGPEAATDQVDREE